MSALLCGWSRAMLSGATSDPQRFGSSGTIKDRECSRVPQQGEGMNKKAQGKKMFVMKETVIDLTPHLMEQAQGASGCIGITTGGFDLRKYTQCAQTSWDTK
jgi:hypothetical protein